MSSSRSLRSNDPCAPGLATDPFQYLERVFTYFLQSVFENKMFERTGMQYLSTADGLPDEKNSEIIISSEKPLLESVERRPHITVILGAAQWAQMSLGQLQAQIINSGRKTHTDLVPMSVAYHCQTKLGTHARRIAWWASYFTNIHRPIIMRQAKLHQIGMNHNISPEGPPTAFTGPLATEEISSVVVNVPFFWQPRWSIDPSATHTSVFERAETTLRLRDPVLRPARIKGKLAHSIPLDQFNNPQNPVVQDMVASREE